MSIFSFSITQAFARQDLVPGSRYTSARAAGMGDAFLPFGEDGASALFYNPANFGKLKGTHVEPLNLSLQFNEPFLNNMTPDVHSALGLESFSTTLRQNLGKYMGMGGAYVPTFFKRWFGFGILIQSEVGAVANANGSVTSKSLYQLIPAFGMGTSFAGGIVKVGYSIQWVNQSSGTNTATTNLGYTTGLKQGSGLSHTLGASLNFPYVFYPSLNIVVRNLLGLQYFLPSVFPVASGSTGKPADEKMSLDASFSLSPRLSGPSFMNMSFAFRDFLGSSGMSLMGRLAAGLEFALFERFYVRGGWGSGYPALGASLKSKRAEFGISWFSEEVGSGYQSVRDAKYLIQFQLRAL